MIENLFWCRNLPAVGGVTSVMLYLVKKYPEKPITILYEDGNGDRLYQLSHYCDLIKYSGQNLECKNFFSNYSPEVVEGHIKYEKAYNIVHANYKFLESVEGRKYPLGDWETLAVSDWAGQNCGRPYRVCPNPVSVEGTEKALLLVSATRLAKDKGDIRDRMEKFARRLEERNVPFIWLCFTESIRPIEGITFIKSRMDILPYIKMADFVVQLSSSEACCMTYLEALSLGKPCICTKIPSFYEQGGNDSNTIFLDFDMSNMDEAIDRLNEKFEFKFTPKEDLYGELLIGKRKEKPIPMTMVKVRLTDKWQEGGGIVCSDIGRIPRVDEEILVNEERAKELIAKGRTVMVGLVEESTKEQPKTTKEQPKTTKEQPKTTVEPKKVKKK